MGPAKGQVSLFGESESGLVSGIAQGDQGRIWIGVEAYFATADNGGLYRYDPDGNRFTRYDFEDAGPGNRTVYGVSEVVFDRRDYLWVGTHSGLVRRLETTSMESVTFSISDSGTKSSKVEALFVDREGDLWLERHCGPMLKSIGALPGLRSWVYSSEDPKGLRQGHVSTLLVDSNDTLWVAMAESGLSKSGPDRSKFEEVLSGTVFMDIHEDRRGRLWVSSPLKGVMRIDRESNAIVEAYTEDLEGNPMTLIRAIWEDRSGTLHVGHRDDFARFDEASNVWVSVPYES